MNSTLQDIESLTCTLQQEKGFNSYKKMIEETGNEPSEEGFQRYYSKWCNEHGRFNDINQSKF